MESGGPTHIFTPIDAPAYWRRAAAKLARARTGFADVDGDVVPLVRHAVLDVSGHLDLLAGRDMVVVDADLERAAADRLAILRHLDRVRALRLGLERRDPCHHQPLDQSVRPIRTPPFNAPLFGTTRVSRYQKGKTNLDFTAARDSEWQWHQLGHMQVCTSLQTDNHASTPPLSFLQAGCPSCRPTNSVKPLKAAR